MESLRRLKLLVVKRGREILKVKLTLSKPQVKEIKAKKIVGSK